MSYSEQLEKYYKLSRKADKKMKIYQKIADDLYSKATGEYAMTIHTEIDETGITYEYYYDGFDYTAGRGHFNVSKEKLESLVGTYKNRERKEKLLKLQNLKQNP
jgi:hypothetical protein